MAGPSERWMADPVARLAVRFARSPAGLAWGMVALCVPACLAAAWGGTLPWLGVGGALSLVTAARTASRVSADAKSGALLWAGLCAKVVQPLAFAAAGLGWALGEPLALVASVTFTTALLMEHSTHRMAAKARGAYLHFYPPKVRRSDPAWVRLGVRYPGDRVPWATSDSFLAAFAIMIVSGSAAAGLTAGTALSTLRWALDLRIRIAELRRELAA